MSSNKKILSILCFIGILAGLLFINMFFLKISKSIVDLTKQPQPMQNDQLNLNSQEKINESNKNDLPALEKISDTNLSTNGKEIISNLALYLDNNKENKIENLDLKNNPDIAQSTNFIQLDTKEVQLKEMNNQTIKERYPEFPSVDLEPPVKSKDHPVHIPIIDKNTSQPEINIENHIPNSNLDKNNNSNSTIIVDKSDKNCGANVAENKTSTVEIVDQNKNSTIIKISENRTIIIDLPNKEKTNLNNTDLDSANQIPVHIDSSNVTETHHQKANITRQDTIVIVDKNNANQNTHKNVSEIIDENHKPNVTIVDNTYSANVTVEDEDSCDNDSDDVTENQDINKTASGNLTNYSHNNEEAKKEHKDNKHHKAKQHKSHHKYKHHGKKCRNKMHAHYLELLQNENENLNQETQANLDKINPKMNIVETVNGSSYTQAALSNMIVVDHIQEPKSEKLEKEFLLVDQLNNDKKNELQADQKFDDAISNSENKQITNVGIKKVIRSNKNEVNSSKRISLIASILSLFVFAGICLLGIEIYKNHQKANIIVIDQNEHVEMEKKYDYILLDSDLETQNSTREIGIQEI